jgi:hypothetical protein
MVEILEFAEPHHIVILCSLPFDSRMKLWLHDPAVSWRMEQHRGDCLGSVVQPAGLLVDSNKWLTP